MSKAMTSHSSASPAAPAAGAGSATVEAQRLSEQQLKLKEHISPEDVLQLRHITSGECEDRSDRIDLLGDRIRLIFWSKSNSEVVHV